MTTIANSSASPFRRASGARRWRTSTAIASGIIALGVGLSPTAARAQAQTVPSVDIQPGGGNGGSAGSGACVGASVTPTLPNAVGGAGTNDANGFCGGGGGGSSGQTGTSGGGTPGASGGRGVVGRSPENPNLRITGFAGDNSLVDGRGGGGGGGGGAGFFQPNGTASGVRFTGGPGGRGGNGAGFGGGGGGGVGGVGFVLGIDGNQASLLGARQAVVNGETVNITADVTTGGAGGDGGDGGNAGAAVTAAPGAQASCP